MSTHDLVVVGGGVAGTMAVLAGVTRGMDVAWVADRVGPTAQSGRWHAHLHRGRLYDPVRESDLIAELQQNAPFWWSDPVRRYHAAIPTLAIGPDRAWAAEFRGILDGNRGEEVRPRFLRRDAVAVRTDEAILRGPLFLTAATAVAASRSTHIADRATALRRHRDGWEVRAGDRATRASAAVVATGVALDDLIPHDVHLDHPRTLRLSRMLVLRGRLPRAAAIVPSRAAGGLFFASRELHDGSGERVWLVSDGFNTPGDRSPSALTDAWWACSVMERMYGFIRAEVFDGVRAAAYLAPKSRLEGSPTQVPARGIAVDAESRLVALTPSKWSSSPTSAVDALAALSPDPLSPPERISAMADALAWAPKPSRVFREAWEILDPHIPVAALRTPGTEALERGAEMFGTAGAEVVRTDDALSAVG